MASVAPRDDTPQPADIVELILRLEHVLRDFAERQREEIAGDKFALIDRSGVARAFAEFAQCWAADPMQMWLDLSRLTMAHTRLGLEFMKGEESASEIAHLRGDRRYSCQRPGAEPTVMHSFQ
jgi:hypothetical protein